MRDGAGSIVAKADTLRRAEGAIGQNCAGIHGSPVREELVFGNAEAAIAKMSICSWLGLKEMWGVLCPSQEHKVSLDFVVKIDGVECWFGVIMLDGELVLLEDNDLSIMRQNAIEEYGPAVTREIVTRVSRRIGRLSGWDRQTVAVICDPMRSIRRHGGLEEALEELGKRCAWLSAVALAGDEHLEIHDVPGSTNPLDGRVRDGILRMHDRRLLALDPAGAKPRRG